MRERELLALVGTVLQASYRLTRLIGAGGMGAVFEAEHLRLNTKVAVKVMVRDLAANEEALARFRREAEVTSRIGHPHIVHVSDFGTTPGGEPYMVMEFLEGEDLDHKIRREGRCSLAATISLVKQVGSALAASHTKGVVHRDLKPANLFLLQMEGETDFVKVVDFGISKVRAATTKLTGSSVIMGTPNYMSPEQAMGRVDEIDHRTDQWSLACIAYEMLAGRGPFVGESAASLLYQVIHQAPPPLALHAPELPSEVEQVLLRALSKEMSQRYESITAFSRALVAAGVAKAGAAGTSVGPTKILPLGGEASGPAAAPPTTFSRAASELVVGTGAPRVPTRRFVAMAGAALVLVFGIFWFTRTPSGPTAAIPNARVSVPAAAPSPVLAPSPPSESPRAAPVPPTPVPAQAAEPSVAPKVEVSQHLPVNQVRRMANDRRTPTLIKVNKPPAAKWVDPFEAESTPGRQPADRVVAPKPKRRIIEDL